LPKLLKACAPVLVRIAGPPVVLRDSLPPILRPLAVAFPNVSFHLKAGLQEQILEWLPCALIWRHQPDPITLALMGAMEQEAQLMRQHQDDFQRGRALMTNNAVWCAAFNAAS
jgi:hypothetical protein